MHRRVAVVPIKSKRLGTTTTPSAISPAKMRAPIADARNKIIARNRSKITDAREKLAQITKQSGDVRQKLLRKQQQHQQNGGRGAKIPPAGLTSASAARHAHTAAASFPPKRHGHGGGRAPHAAGGPVAVARHPVNIDDMDDDMDIDFVPAAYALRRTVHNDIAYTKMPPLPQFARVTERARAVAAAAPPPPVAAYRSHQQHPLHPPSYHGHPDSHHRVLRRSPPPVVMHPAHSWSGGQQQPDPFDCYEVPMQRPSDVSEPKHLQRSVRGGHPDLIPTKGILRYGGRQSSSPPPPQHLMRQQQQYQQQYQQQQHHHHRGAYIDDHQLSYEMRNRLERAPDAGQSAGTFSNPYTLQNNHSSKPVAAAQPKAVSSASSSVVGGYRIVVSNLHSSVSQSDIRELFEDIGELVDARLVRPGVAEVIFRTLKDSELAVDTYHNRQLDGQPMKCLLVQPRPASGRPTAPALKSSGGARSSGSSSQHVSSHSHSSSSSRSGGGGGKTPLEIDIDALHKVLFQPKSYTRN